MKFDIRTPDSAFEFIMNFFNITGPAFIDEYIIQCNNCFDEFWEKHLDYIDSIDIDSIQYMAFHVTSNWDECAGIKANGIRNLQEVLSEKNELTNLLLKYGVQFDVDNKILINGDKIIDINYAKYREKYDLSSYEQKIQGVAHKIYYDYQVNGFFSHHDILHYGTEIHIQPEFLSNLSELLPHICEAVNIWRKKSKGYIVTFLADFDQFEYSSFYNNEYEYQDDETNRIKLKKWIIKNAIYRSFQSTDDHTEIFAYIDKATIIKPEQIVEYKEIVVY
ncbi:hypothetical protein ACOBQJ_13255 [Pelotomaculum propionicicum]|uniref:hypothetical protein n=1 Tax=Pelotomaculum propionicicum TaxID=258475 RepID=UPI003B77098B